jgi:hypothetical protein
MLEKIGAKSPVENSREIKLPLTLGAHSTWGYIDDLTIFSAGDGSHKGTLLIDWKFHPTGLFDVHDARLQLVAGSVALLRANEDVRGVVAVTYCPFGDEPLELRMPRKNLPHYEEELLAIYNRASDPKASINPGPHCKYCLAAGGCSAAETFSLQLRIENDCWRLSGERYEVLDPERFKGRYERVRAAQAILEKWVDQAKRVLMDVEARGWKSDVIGLRDGANRAVIEHKEDALGKIPEDIRSILLKKAAGKWSLSDLEAAMLELQPDTKRKDIRQAAEALLGESLSYKRNAPSIFTKERKSS